MQRRLSIMTVFLPRENIFFIAEWLNYHIALGFTHFYLYNNMSSRFLDGGNNLEITGANKQGEKVYRLVSHKTDEEVLSDLRTILAAYVASGYVTNVVWQPRDEHGHLTYGQSRAFLHYVDNYAAELDWVAFMDMDEFIVPGKDNDAQSLVECLSQDGITFLRIPQKPFRSRFGLDGTPAKNVLKIFECGAVMPPHFGSKAMVRTDTLRTAPEDRYNIHSPVVDANSSLAFCNPDVARFNHYKFSQRAIAWAREHLNLDASLDSVDDSAMRLYERILCNNQLSTRGTTFVGSTGKQYNAANRTLKKSFCEGLGV